MADVSSPVIQIDSILNSIKKSLGLAADYHEFDPEIIMYINGAFSTLNQLGVGDVDGYSIVDETDKWLDFFDGEENKFLNSVKSYVYLKVRLIFDPPQTSFAIEAITKQATELEWRFTVVHDSATIAAIVTSTP